MRESVLAFSSSEQSKPRRCADVSALSEPIVLTEIGESFIDRSVKYGRNFLSSKRIQDVRKAPTMRSKGRVRPEAGGNIAYGCSL